MLPYPIQEAWASEPGERGQSLAIFSTLNGVRIGVAWVDKTRNMDT